MLNKTKNNDYHKTIILSNKISTQKKKKKKKVIEEEKRREKRKKGTDQSPVVRLGKLVHWQASCYLL